MNYHISFPFFASIISILFVAYNQKTRSQETKSVTEVSRSHTVAEIIKHSREAD